MNRLSIRKNFLGHERYANVIAQLIKNEDAFKEIYFSLWLGFSQDNIHLPRLSNRALYKTLMEDH